MKSLARRIFGSLIGLVTGWPVDAPSGPGSDAAQPSRADQAQVERPPGQHPRSRLSPGAAEIQAELARRQLRGDAIERGRPRQVPQRRRTSRLRDTPRTGPRAGYSWGKSPGDRTRESTSRTPTPRFRPDRARPVLNRDQRRRSDEREVRRYRQTRRAIEAKAAELVDPPESRLSDEALDAQDALVREQSQRDAETRAEERPYRTPLRDRTRIGPLRGILKPRPNLPTRDPRLDMLVTAGFIAAALLIGGLTRLDLYDYSGLPWLLAAAMAATLVALLILDNRRWSGSGRVRITRTGMVAGLVFFIGVTSIGRLGELAPVPLPDGCSSEQASAWFRDQASTADLVAYAASVDRHTGALRRPGRLASDAERAFAYRERGAARALLGDPERSLADLQRSLELDSTHLYGYIVRARLFQAAGCQEAGRDDMAAIVRHYAATDDGQTLIDAAELLWDFALAFDERDYARSAIDVAGRAASLMTSPYEAQVLQGKILASAGRFDEALDVLTLGVEGYRLNFEAHLFRGLVHRRLGSTQAALDDFELALRRRPKSADARAALGITLFGSGQVEKGLEALNEAVQLDEEESYAYQWRGQALLQNGQPEAARAEFQRIIQAGFDSADAYVGRAVAELALGNRQRAVQALETIRTRPVNWTDEPTISMWIRNLERELGQRSST